MITIAIANQKGGCGKTTTAINLAASLGQQHQQRVLLIDMDPQGHASLGLGLACSEQAGLYEVLLCEEDINDVITPTSINGVDLIAATISLAAVEQLLANISKKDLQLLLHLENLNSDYDFVIIDCPPQLGLLSFNALRAANEVIIPLEMSAFSVDGVERLTDTITLLRDRTDSDIPLRILPTMVDYRTRITNLVLDDIRERFRDIPIAEPIHFTVRIKEASYHGKPIMEFSPNSPAADDYYRLGESIMSSTSAVREIISASRQGFATTGNDSRTAGKTVYPDADRAPVAKGEITDTDRDDELQTVVLTFADTDIDELYIAGEFNDWIPDYLVTTEHQGGLIKKILRLSPGRYQYRLVINGNWQNDPYNPEQIINEYGETNSILVVGSNAPVETVS